MRAAAAEAFDNGRLSRDEIDRLKATVRLEEVVAHYVPSLKRVGERWVGLCPFHDDTEPSFNIWSDSQSWYCFGACRRGGDVLDFLQEVERVDFRTALDLLGGPAVLTQPPLTGLEATPWPVQPPDAREPRPAPAEPELTCEDRAILSATAEIYYRSLMGNLTVRRTLEARGLSTRTMTTFHLGYSSGRRLARYLAWRHMDLDRARALGLLHDDREHLRQRIVVPVMRGWQTVYLIGRATREDQKPKYLGLAGPKVPLRSRSRPSGRCGLIVVEGPFDLMLLHEWGYHRHFELLALLGTQFKPRWLDDLPPNAPILVATDQDEAGEASAAELEALFPGRAVRLRWPAPYEDIGDLAQAPDGREVLARSLEVAGCSR